MSSPVNDTIISDPPFPQPEPYGAKTIFMIGSTIYCMALENSVRGLIDLFFAVRARKQWNINLKIIFTSNILLMTKFALDWAQVFVTPSPDFAYDAMKWGTLYNVSVSASMLSIDCFLLYKTWVVCSKTRFFKVIAIIVWLLRLFWAVTNISKAFVICYEGFGCGYNEHRLLRIGNVIGDAIIDITCTLYIVLSCQVHLKSDIKYLAVVIMTENLLRTFFLFIFNCVTVWTFLAYDELDPVVKLVTTYLYAYVTAVALNSEFY
ncbi:hypothetical protein BCR33DRAFT_717353, partial [Rhizoclosmatium globosum]